MENILKTVYKFKLPQINTGSYNCYRGYKIIIVGCGGTGGYLIRDLGRILKVKSEEGTIFQLIFIDADNVEYKNLTRQNFSVADVGKNKAEVMAKKIAGAYQLSAKALDKYLEDPAEVLELIESSAAERLFPIIVGCVDSMQCRKIIDEAMKQTPHQAVWIDAGNEEFFGQVIVNAVNGTSLEELDRKGVEEGYFNLPSFVDIAPHLFQGNLQKTSEISCAEHALENVQNIGANILSGAMLFLTLNNLLATGNNAGIDSHMLKFDAKLMQVINTPTTLN